MTTADQTAAVSAAAAEYRARVARGETPLDAMAEACEPLTWPQIEQLGDKIQLWPWRRA